MKIDIYFRDLRRQKQREILEMLGISDEKELNWDTIPVFEFTVENDS